jgi:hypothetical protein
MSITGMWHWLARSRLTSIVETGLEFIFQCRIDLGMMLKPGPSSGNQGI